MTKTIKQPMGGWQCPRCGQINAFWKDKCDCFPQTISKSTIDNGTTPIYPNHPGAATPILVESETVATKKEQKSKRGVKRPKKKKENIKFFDYKQKILDSLNAKTPHLKCNCGSQEFLLVDGFVNQVLQKELTGALVIGGPSVLMIILVCEKCGKAHYFALSKLLDLEL